jgi:hypothetical protein
LFGSIAHPPPRKARRLPRESPFTPRRA